MPRYRIECSAFKRSGKYYNSKTIDLGFHLEYPNDVISKAKAEIYEDLDAACALVPNAIASNNYIVLIQVMDDTNSPVVHQSLVL